MCLVKTLLNCTKNMLDNIAVCDKVYSNKDVKEKSEEAPIVFDRSFFFLGEDAQATKQYERSSSFLK